MGQNQSQLGRNAFGTDDDKLIGLCFDCRECLAINCEIEPGGKPHGAEHAELVLGNASPWITDGPHHMPLQILLTTDVINHPLLQRVEKQTIDRKIPPLGIVLGVGKRHRVRMATIAVARIATKRGDIDLTRSLRAQYRDNSKRRTNFECPPLTKDFPHTLGHCIRRDIVVLGQTLHELIPHTPAGPQRLMPAVAKTADDFDREFAGQLGINDGHDEGEG
jgi:hypothetical protein